VAQEKETQTIFKSHNSLKRANIKKKAAFQLFKIKGKTSIICRPKILKTKKRTRASNLPEGSNR
jgi:hypothetical protein